MGKETVTFSNSAAISKERTRMFGKVSSTHGRWILDDRWAAAVELLKLYLMILLVYGIIYSVIDARIFLSLPPAS